MPCVFHLFSLSVLSLNSKKPFHTQIWAVEDASRLRYCCGRYHRQHVPSFPGQQNRMAIMPCCFCVSEHDHRSSHENRASSYLHIKPSLSFVLFHHPNLPITSYQNAQMTDYGSGLPRLLRDLLLREPWGAECVSASDSSVATDVNFQIEDRIDMCCYSLRLLQTCGEYHDVSRTHIPKNTSDWNHDDI